MELGQSQQPVDMIQEPVIATTVPPLSEKKGVYHTIKPKETLWRIAKTYNVAIGEIVKANYIQDVSRVEKGQIIFIPGAEILKEVFLETPESQKDFIWPVQGQIISRFGQYKDGRVNQGIDIRSVAGTVVRAARTGRVVFADYLPGQGYVVVLDHTDGFYSLYAHNAKLLVRLNDLVLKNASLAHVGMKNNLAFLHFEIRRKTISDNPLYYLP